MRGSQQIATPVDALLLACLACPLNCNQDKAEPAEAHTHSAAHRDLRHPVFAIWGRANVTTLTCRAAIVTFLALWSPGAEVMAKRRRSGLPKGALRAAFPISPVLQATLRGVYFWGTIFVHGYGYGHGVRRTDLGDHCRPPSQLEPPRTPTTQRRLLDMREHTAVSAGLIRSFRKMC